MYGTSLKSSTRSLELASSPLLALNSRKRTLSSIQGSYSEYARETLTAAEKERDSVKSRTIVFGGCESAGCVYFSFNHIVVYF